MVTKTALASQKKKDIVNEIDPTHHLIYQLYQGGLERYYFWLVEFIHEDLKYDVEKLEDAFTASELSSFWGVQSQRLAIQQDKAKEFLAIIGNMLKSLFQILRSLRIMDERMNYYKKSKAGSKSAEIALKGMWIDLVEGSAKNPASVYGMATQLGFTTLPDFFFNLSPKKAADVDGEVAKLDQMGLNKKVQEVLGRKLYQFLEWKEATEKEIEVSRRFHLKYLRQHFNVIKLYIKWVKPYLKNVERLQTGSSKEEWELIGAADMSLVDIEIFGVNHGSWKRGTKNVPYAKYFPCIQLKFRWRSVPEMAYMQEYQKGPIHLGRTEIFFKSMALTQQQIDNHKKEKDKEDIDLLASVNAAMDAMKDELFRYLAEADDELAKKEKTKVEFPLFKKIDKLPNPFEPFSKIGKGFNELFGALIPVGNKNAPSGWVAKREEAAAKKQAGDNLFLTYDIFKKAHGLIYW